MFADLHKPALRHPEHPSEAEEPQRPQQHSETPSGDAEARLLGEDQGEPADEDRPRHQAKSEKLRPGLY
jgi:hypothetical protein